MTKKYSILAICGSLRPNSSNAAILKKMAEMSTEADFVFYEGLAGLPHFNPDLEAETTLHAVAELRGMITKADAVLICTPEYAFGVPGSLKNALDWTVSSGEFVNKPVALITASSVGTHAHAALLLTLNAISAKIIDASTLLIPFIRTKVNAEGTITDAELLSSLQAVLQSLIAAI